MKGFYLLSSAFFATVAMSSPIAKAEPFVGYLISTFSDPMPQVQWHLSDSASPATFRFLNNGASVLASTVGTKGVRDIFLTTNSARSEYFIIATGK